MAKPDHDQDARRSAIIEVLRSAGEPLNHGQIVQRLTPWYDDPKSFKASVSSQLGILRAQKLISAQKRSTGATFFLHGRRIREEVRFWELVPAAAVLRDYQQQSLDQMAGAMGITYEQFIGRGFHRGGFVPPLTDRRLQKLHLNSVYPRDHGKSHTPLYNPEMVDKITTTARSILVDIRPRYPRTDDMKQMLDDLRTVGPLPKDVMDARVEVAFAKIKRRIVDDIERKMAAVILDCHSTKS